jgi:hypothetical protein
MSVELMEFSKICFHVKADLIDRQVNLPAIPSCEWKSVTSCLFFTMKFFPACDWLLQCTVETRESFRMTSRQTTSSKMFSYQKALLFLRCSYALPIVESSSRSHDSLAMYAVKDDKSFRIPTSCAKFLGKFNFRLLITSQKFQP